MSPNGSSHPRRARLARRGWAAVIAASILIAGCTSGHPSAPVSSGRTPTSAGGGRDRSRDGAQRALQEDPGDPGAGQRAHSVRAVLPQQFQPLPTGDIDAYQNAGFAWPLDPQRCQVGFGFLKLRPEDMAKIGTLYLNGGRWQGRQIVPAAWIRDATTAHVPFPGQLPLP